MRDLSKQWRRCPIKFAVIWCRQRAKLYDSLCHLLRGARMVKCTKRQIRQLKTALQFSHSLGQAASKKITSRRASEDRHIGKQSRFAPIRSLNEF
jgi:hypothetical protein